VPCDTVYYLTPSYKYSYVYDCCGRGDFTFSGISTIIGGTFYCMEFRCATAEGWFHSAPSETNEAQKGGPARDKPSNSSTLPLPRSFFCSVCFSSQRLSFIYSVRGFTSSVAWRCILYAREGVERCVAVEPEARPPPSMTQSSFERECEEGIKSAGLKAKRGIHSHIQPRVDPVHLPDSSRVPTDHALCSCPASLLYR
jgi:hypothetical protein